MVKGEEEIEILVTSDGEVIEVEIDEEKDEEE